MLQVPLQEDIAQEQADETGGPDRCRQVTTKTVTGKGNLGEKSVRIYVANQTGRYTIDTLLI